MNIAYLSTFYPFRGGIAQFNASLYRAFEELGHHPSAYTFTRQYPEMLFPGQTQIVTQDDIADPIPSKRIVDSINPISWLAAAKTIEEQHPDILLTKFWMPFMAPSLGTISGRLEKTCKRICIVDNALPHERRPGDIALTKYFINRQDAFVVMSDTVERDLLSLKPAAKILRHEHPLYDHFGEAVDKQKAREELHLPKDAKLLLFFGFIRNYKGLSVLLDALHRLPEEYHVVIGGECYGSFEEYDKQIKELNIGNRVHTFVRYISDKEAPLFFSAADVCVLPYLSATQSGIIAIAHHFLTPVIATNVGSLNEALRNGEAGMLIEKADPGLVAKSVMNFFEQKLQERCLAGVRKLKEENSWKALGKAIVDFAGTL